MTRTEDAWREKIGERDAEIKRLRNAIRLARNILHAHNRSDARLPNEARIRARDILDLSLEQDALRSLDRTDKP